MNRATIIGRLTRDPELQTKGEMKWCRYTLAVDRRGKGEDRQADFLNCIAWDGRADFAFKHFTKGLRVAVSGRIQTGSYTNKDGVKIPTFDIVVDDQEFADGKSEKPAEEPKAKKKEDSDFRPLDPVADEGLQWEL